ncbi:hypothetical protein ABIB26_002412 [Arthrobacter sp. UYEF20]
MTIVQRTFSAAFQHGPATRRRATRSSQAPVVTEVRAAGVSAGFTAAPWEGLYLEVDDAVGNAADGGRAAVSESQRFLARRRPGLSKRLIRRCLIHSARPHPKVNS